MWMRNDALARSMKAACTRMVGSSRKGKRSLVWTICTLAIVLAGVSVWMSAPTVNDPVYEGRRLSSWLRNYPHTGPQPMDAPSEGVRLISSEEKELFYRKHFGKEVAEGHRALLAVGDDALPLLVQMMGKRERLCDCGVHPDWNGWLPSPA